MNPDNEEQEAPIPERLRDAKSRAEDAKFFQKKNEDEQKTQGEKQREKYAKMDTNALLIEILIALKAQ